MFEHDTDTAVLCSHFHSFNNSNLQFSVTIIYEWDTRGLKLSSSHRFDRHRHLIGTPEDLHWYGWMEWTIEQLKSSKWFNSLNVYVNKPVTLRLLSRQQLQTTVPHDHPHLKIKQQYINTNSAPRRLLTRHRPLHYWPLRSCKFQ